MENVRYVVRSGALHAMASDGSLVVVPKLATVTHLGLVEDHSTVNLERRKGQSVHALEFEGQTVFFYASQQKVYPEKDNLEVWFDNFWNVAFGPVKA